MRIPLMLLILLTGCSVASAPAQTPQSQAAQPTSEPSGAIASTPALTSVAPPEPTPLPLLRLGQSATLDAVNATRNTVMVHAVQRLAADPQIGITKPYLLIDWSVRNDGSKSFVWQRGTGNPAVLSANGQRLNEEVAFDGTPLTTADLGANPAACAAAPGSTLPRYLDILVASGGLSLPPGAVYRSFSAFSQTQGLETADLHFEVSFPLSQQLDGPRVRAEFDLGSPAAPAPLPWQGAGANPSDSVVTGDVEVSSVKAGPVEAAKSGTVTGLPQGCGLQRTVHLTLTNQGARSVTLSGGLLLLLDTDGHLYAPRDNPFISLDPRGQQNVEIAYPALKDRGTPAALYVGSIDPSGTAGAVLVRIVP